MCVSACVCAHLCVCVCVCVEQREFLGALWKGSSGRFKLPVFPPPSFHLHYLNAQKVGESRAHARRTRACEKVPELNLQNLPR